MRGLTKTLQIGDREVVVTEPSMIAIRNFLESQIKPISDPLMVAAFRDSDEAYLAMLPLLTGYSAAQLETEFEARFSEVRQVIAAAREVAPDFFALVDRLIEFARKQSPPPS